MVTTPDTLRRFTTSDGYHVFFLDGVWRDGLCAAATDMTFDGTVEGPVSDFDEGPLPGVLDLVQPVLRVEWIDGPRTGQVARVPMIGLPDMLQVGGVSSTGWRLARGHAPDWVAECLEYGINEGADLQGSRRLADTADDEGDGAGALLNLAYRVEFLPVPTTTP
ncbi:hypothetical protein [Azospirillum sp. sgz302134]